MGAGVIVSNVTLSQASRDRMGRNFARIVTAVAIVAVATLLLQARIEPASAQPVQIDVLLTGLVNPRGLAFGPDGALYIAEAGQGGETAVRAGFYHIPFKIGRTARVSRLLPSGEWQTVLGNLPSVQTPDDIFGATGVAFLDDTLYVLTAAGGRDVGDPSFDNEILSVSPGGDVSQLVNITSLNYQNPPLARLRDLRADVEGGVPFGLTAYQGRLYATDSNLETVTEIDRDGATRRLVELPASNRVLVGLTPAPDGSLWVAEYGPMPHVRGGAKISRLTLDGEMTDAWTNLNLAIAVAFGPDGSAYALQFAVTTRSPAAGSVLRRWPDGRVETIATGLTFPTAMTVGPDGNLYVAEYGHKSENETGRIIRLHVAPA